MKRLILPACAALAAIGLSSCADVEEDRDADRASRFGYAGDEAASTTTTSTTTSTRQVGPPPPETTTVIETTPSVTTTTTSPDPVVVTETVKKDYPYGTPVSGKTGFVTSPHAPYSGYVDVRGFPPGTEVKDPYTGKIFLVP